MPLEEYQAKRDFDLTAEPAGSPAGAGSGGLRFVVQEHHARQLHYDFRLELDGVLVSWAVPKGPSLDPAEKHLAVHVEDHPLEYASFEGTIPAGQYGAGSVIVWDSGTWQPLGDPREGLARGDFKFTLDGKKLRGLWVLVRLKPRPNERRESWLLIKERDEFARPHAEYDLLAEKPESVVSGLRLDEVGDHAVAGGGGRGSAEEDGGGSPSASAADGPEAHGPAEPPPNLPGLPPPSKRAATAALTSATPAADPQAARGRTTTPVAEPIAAPLPDRVEFELATLVETAPKGAEWISEVKYDGYRIALAIDGETAKAYSRSYSDWSDKFAPLVSAAKGLPASSAIIDGEAIVLDDDGISEFELLQVGIGAHPEQLSYAAFDLLYLNGYDLRELPLLARKQLLRDLLGESSSPLFYADHVVGNAAQFHQQACDAGLEGIVCKRADSHYVGGRWRDWLKVKCRMQQEFVVGGFTEGGGTREGFGALLVGTYEGGQLVYHGRVGTGFDHRTLAALRTRLDALERKKSPFDPEPKQPTGPPVHWVAPKLVAEVAFREWTRSGTLRQPAFLGLREDKEPKDVVRERPGARGSASRGSRPKATVVPADDGLRSPRLTPARSGAHGSDIRVLDTKITNPEKKLFPQSAFTKKEFAEYYAAIAPVMLPEVGERPLTLLRCPIGEGEGCFYQRHPDAGLPSAVKTMPYLIKGEPVELLWIDSADGLVSLAQMGALEVHLWGSRIDSPKRPDRIVFDLDPGPDLPWPQICSAAQLVREECSALGFEPFVKSTGSKGLHVVLPIEPVWEFDRIRALTHSIAERIASRHPDSITANMLKSKRAGRVYFDYLRNAETASAVAPYSTRNRPGPTCAVPLAWDELVDSLDIGAFTPGHVVERITAGIDPWATLGDTPAGTRVLKSAEKSLEG